MSLKYSLDHGGSKETLAYPFSSLIYSLDHGVSKETLVYLSFPAFEYDTTRRQKMSSASL